MSEVTQQTPQSITLGGKVKLNTAISMLFTDILSQEMSDAITNPGTVSILQQYLKNRSPEEMQANMMAPLLENIPDSVANLIQEAVFCSGAGIKNLDCLYEVKIGDPLQIRESNIFAQLEVRDGVLNRVSPLRR